MKTKHTPKPYRIAQDATPVAYLTITEPKPHRVNHECAAWFHQYEVAPGVYPVYSRGPGQYGVEVLAVSVEATVVGGCLVSMFGGVPIGSDDPIKREIGRTESVDLNSYHYAMPSDNYVPFAEFGTLERVTEVA